MSASFRRHERKCRRSARRPRRSFDGRSKSRESPVALSEAERREHEVSRYPLHSWCRHCVAGTGKIDGRNKVSTITATSMTWTKLPQDQRLGALEEMSKGKSQFFEKGRRHGSVFALVCPQKKVCECVVARFAAYVLSLGLNRVRLRSDGEPPIGGLLGGPWQLSCGNPMWRCCLINPPRETVRQEGCTRRRCMRCRAKVRTLCMARFQSRRIAMLRGLGAYDTQLNSSTGLTKTVLDGRHQAGE